MINGLINGFAQGVGEWLPISSEGLILFIQEHLGSMSVSEIIRYALFLHLGTFLAALIYFRKDVAILIKDLFGYKNAPAERQSVLNFYVIATIVSGAIGFGILKAIEGVESTFAPATRVVIIALGVLLLITGLLQITKRSGGQRKERDITLRDSILLGFVQGFAAFPGLSRSGLTVSALLLRKFDDDVALKLSFIMSLPIVLAGNILLNLGKFSLNYENIVALITSFVFGIITIHALLKFAKKINFGWFVTVFSILVFVSAFFV